MIGAAAVKTPSRPTGGGRLAAHGGLVMVATPAALATADAAGLVAAAVLLVYLVYAVARAERF